VQLKSTDNQRLTSEVADRRRQQPDAAGAVNSRRQHVACGCSAGMEQSASTDQDRLVSRETKGYLFCQSLG